MDRRKFLRSTMGLGFTPLFLNNSLLKGYDNLLGFDDFTCSDIRNRSLVFIDLFGGNDGINTVIPVQQAKYDLYAANRVNIAIPKAGAANGALNLDTTIPEERQISLHPSMTGLKSLYDQGKLNVLNGVGYLNNNRSHFKANDHWLSAGDSTGALSDLESGWIGRYLSSVYPANVDGPTDAFPDPLGLELGSSSSSLLFKTDSGKFSNILLTLGAGDYYNFVAGLGTPLPTSYGASQFKDEIAYINSVERSSNAFSQRISNVFTAGSNATTVTYPNTSLANQLKTVARLIKGGSKTKVFLVHHSGYDTHNGQAVLGATHTGSHANLLKTLSDAIKAFQDDLAALGIDDQVVTSTYSEFGRTVDQNANNGTDHGGVNPMFVIGKGIQGGVSGNPIDLTRLSNRGCIDLQFDYRRVYSTLLQDFLAVDNTIMNKAKLDNYIATKAPVLKATHISPSTCYSGLSVLPIVLLDLTARAVGNEAVKVSWVTAQEINTNKFYLERSNDGQHYTRIATLAAAGTSYADINYEWMDYEAKEGINYYRLVQTDIDNRQQVFGPVHATLRKTRVVDVKTFPNPSVTEFKLSVRSPVRQEAQVVFFDMDGHLLLSRKLTLQEGMNTFTYPNTLFKSIRQLIVSVRFETGNMATVKQLLQ